MVIFRSYVTPSATLPGRTLIDGGRDIIQEAVLYGVQNAIIPYVIFSRKIEGVPSGRSGSGSRSGKSVVGQVA